MSYRLNSPIPTDEWWLSLGSVSSLFLIWMVHRSKRSWKRYPSIDYLTKPMYDHRLKLKGKVISVGDGDNFRFYHIPWMWRLFPIPIKGE
jgi:hypothetical protein